MCVFLTFWHLIKLAVVPLNRGEKGRPSVAVVFVMHWSDASRHVSAFIESHQTLLKVFYNAWWWFSMKAETCRIVPFNNVSQIYLWLPFSLLLVIKYNAMSRVKMLGLLLPQILVRGMGTFMAGGRCALGNFNSLGGQGALTLRICIMYVWV